MELLPDTLDEDELLVPEFLTVELLLLPDTLEVDELPEEDERLTLLTELLVPELLPALPPTLVADELEVLVLEDLEIPELFLEELLLETVEALVEPVLVAPVLVVLFLLPQYAPPRPYRPKFP